MIKLLTMLHYIRGKPALLHAGTVCVVVPSRWRQGQETAYSCLHSDLNRGPSHGAAVYGMLTLVPSCSLFLFNFLATLLLVWSPQCTCSLFSM